MKKLGQLGQLFMVAIFLLVITIFIFAAIFFSSCASINKAPENPAPSWVTGPVLYQDGDQVFAVGKFQGQDITVARTAAETLAIRRIAMYIKKDEVANTQVIGFWRDTKENISYVLVKYQK